MTTKGKQWIEGHPETLPVLSIEQMKQDILWYVAQYDYVSLAELARRYGAQAQGDHAIEIQENLLIWANISGTFSDALLQLRKEGAIHIHPSSVLVYFVDGMTLKFPIAKRPPPGGYKEPHWIPVTLRPGPFCRANDCPKRLIERGNKRQQSSKHN